MTTIYQTREDARAAGLKHYFTGSQCGRGHVAPRYVSTANCSACAAEQRRRWQQQNPEKRRASEAKYRRIHAVRVRDRTRRCMEANPKVQMLASARYRARSAGLEFAITADDILIPERCPVFGLVLKRGKGRQAPNSPSLDRINTALGYIPGNVQVISHRANTLKGDASAAELVALARYVGAHKPV